MNQLEQVALCSWSNVRRRSREVLCSKAILDKGLVFQTLNLQRVVDREITRKHALLPTHDSWETSL